MMEKFKKFLRNLANPFLAETLPVGMLVSPLDAVGERNGLPVMEELCAQPSVARIGSAFDDYLGEPFGTLALRKALHLFVEDRIHALAIINDPPEEYGFRDAQAVTPGRPLDSIAARALKIEAPRRRGKWRVPVATLVQCAYFLGNAIAIGCRAGRRTVTVRRISVASPAISNEHYWSPLLRAATEYPDESREPFVLIAEPGYAVDPNGAIPLLRPGTMPVDIGRWWKEIVRPGIRLVFAAVATLLRRPADEMTAAAAWSVVHLARRGLEFARLLQGMDIRNYLDVTEYSALHIVKAAYLQRQGGRLVRWPHCVLDNPGAILSFLGYHYYLSAGPYEARNYSRTWAAHTQPITVGFFKNDRYWNDVTTRVEKRYASAIEERRASGNRLIVYFGPSGDPSRDEMVYETVRAVVEAVSADPDSFLVIKAKSAKGAPQIDRVLKRISTAVTLLAESRLIVIDYAKPGIEPCPAGWLIAKMDAGIGLGSVQLESLTQGKPLFSYFPVIQDTPYQQILTACGLNHLTAPSLEKALRHWLDAPGSFHVPYDWFRDNFDPYGDDRALSRIAALLWGNASPSSLTPPPGKGSPDQDIPCQTHRTAHTA